MEKYHKTGSQIDYLPPLSLVVRFVRFCEWDKEITSLLLFFFFAALWKTCRA